VLSAVRTQGGWRCKGMTLAQRLPRPVRSLPRPCVGRTALRHLIGARRWLCARSEAFITPRPAGTSR
jgi:hypothetical protein